MPYDLQRGADRVRAAYDEPMALRQRMLDMLFAAGCSVSEQAVSLADGEAMALQAAGPGAERDAQPRVFLAVDVEAPGARSLTPRWPCHLASLGGPDIAIGWLGLVRALVEAEPKTGWHAVYVRGAAVAVDGYLRSIAARLPREAALYQLLPRVAAAAVTTEEHGLHVLRVTLRRAKNVWRLPSCDHAYVVEGLLPSGEVFGRLRAVLGRVGRALDWTLHDLRAASGAGAQLSAVLRTSAPVDVLDDTLRLTPLEDDSRLMFPVNDALEAIAALAEAAPASLGGLLARPIAMQVLPDGLWFDTILAGTAAQQVAGLPRHVGGMDVATRTARLCGPPPRAVLDVSGAPGGATGPVPGRLDELGATVVRMPDLGDPQVLAQLHTAFAQVFAER